jgi:replicative DNA helicase
MYTWLLGHWAKYGEMPTDITVKDNWPTVRILEVGDTVEYLLDQMVAARKYNATVRMIQKSGEMLEDEKDFEGVLSFVRARVVEIDDEGGSISSDVDVTKTTEERLTEYAELKNVENGMLGYETGFPTIDRATNGLQPGQLVTTVAQPKAGKSTLMVAIAKHIHQNYDARLLLISFEMTNKEQEMRLDAMVGSVSSARLRTGQLKPSEERRLQQRLGEFAKRDEFWLTQDASGSTVSGIAAKIEKYKPSIVLIDGVYLMIDEISKEQNSATALTNITRNMKKLALRTNIPIVISTQALLWKMQKKKVTSDSIGYSSSFFQDSDVILGLEHVPGEDGENDEFMRRLKVVDSRNCPPVSANVLWNWEESVFEETGEYEVAV